MAATGSSSNSISSSSSGTIVSASCASSTPGLPYVSMEVDLHLDLGIHDHDEERVSREETEERRMRQMVQEFFGGDASRVLERWLRELGVGWVLHLADDAAPDGASSPGWVHGLDAAGSWFRALTEIMEILRCTASLFPDPAGSVSVGFPCICEQQEEPAEAATCIPDQFQFARFIQEIMLKMLPFVDVIVAVDPNGVPGLHYKINILLRLRAPLSDALSDIEESFVSTTSPQVEFIAGEMVDLLCAKHAKAGEAIWSTLKETRTRILDSWANHQTPQGSSSDVHKVTLSVMGHINFLLDNYSSVSPIVSEAESLGKYNYVPLIQGQPHLDTMIMDIMSCLKEHLVNMSESLQDQGLRFLFLLNNSNFIADRLQSNTWYSSLQVHAAAIFGKPEGYMESYLQVSWAPVLSCLINPTPLCLLFGKFYYSPALPKFEAEFQKTYTAQKLWKVPDPELRKTLREAITEKIIPAYTKYMEENNIATPRISSQELQGMLRELFEG